MKAKKTGCKCQKCGFLFKVDLIVPDDLWIKITPKPHEPSGGLLCGACIVKLLEKIGFSAWKLIKI